MGLLEEVTADIDGALRQTWELRDGRVVPSTADIALSGGGVRLDVAMLYADLADSTELAIGLDKRVTARIYKAFLSSSSRIIRQAGGAIRSFDGDRVMGIFVGEAKESTAAKVALRINWTVKNLIKPKFTAKYDVFQQSAYSITHCCGVDTSEVLVVRAGVRNDNDLVWVGRAPNVAAKLSNIRNLGVATFITSTVYSRLSGSAKFSNGTDMWTRYSWDKVSGISTVYGSTYWWKL